MTIRTFCLSVFLIFAAAPAFAHPGHAGSGFVHPFTGLDHLLAVIGVGVWASLVASRKPSAVLSMPAAFIVVMAVGAAAGFAGINLPIAEAAILASVFSLGGLVLIAVRMPATAAIALVALFALFHGYAHAVEAPAVNTGVYMLGFLSATAILLSVGLALGWVVRRLAGDLGVRALGGLILAGGALVLAVQ
jgi:urease accessory protein